MDVIFNTALLIVDKNFFSFDNLILMKAVLQPFTFAAS